MFPTEEKASAAFWSKQAGVYDGSYMDYFCTEAAQQLVVGADLEGLAEHVGGGHNVTILDVGAGTGSATLAAARSLPDAKIVASDVSQGMLDALKVKTGDSPRTYSNIETLLASATNLEGVDDDSVDVVFSSLALMFVDDLPAAFSEINRVLRPGGRCFLATWATLSMCPAIDAVFKALEAVRMAKSVRTGAEYTPIRHQPNEIFALADSDQLLSLLTQAGLEDADVSPARISYERGSLSELTGMVMQGYGRYIDDEELQTLVTAFQDAIEEPLRQDRVFAMANIAVAEKPFST